MKLNEMIDKAYGLREEKRALEKLVTKIKAELADLDNEILEKLDEVGTTIANGEKAAVAKSFDTVATVKDWNAFGQWIIDNGHLHLLQRRVSNPAYRELLNAEGSIPGTEPFTKVTLNLRAK